jgi:hypothetical protein
MSSAERFDLVIWGSIHLEWARPVAIPKGRVDNWI